MARNATIRFDDDELLEETIVIAETLGRDVNDFIDEAVRKHLAATKRRADYPELLEAEEQRREIDSLLRH